MTKFLLRDFGGKHKRYVGAAHIWDGNDTRCRMWSTGGITKKKRYRVTDSPEGHRICALCQGDNLDRQFRTALEKNP